MALPPKTQPQPVERQHAAGNAHLARNVADRHFPEEHFAQIGVEREIQVARHLDGLHRLGGNRFTFSRLGRRGHGFHDLVQVEQFGLHVEASRKHVAPQQIADVTRQLAVGREVALADRHPEFAEGHRGGRDGSRGAADVHRRQTRKRQPQLLDGEGALRTEFFVAVFLNVGHAARDFEIRGDLAAQLDALLQRVDLLHGPQIDTPGSRGAEYGIADEIRGVEGRRNGVPGHLKAEFRKIDDRFVHHAPGIRHLGGDVDAGHGFRERGVLEAAVADLGFQFKGRKRRTAHLALGPKRHRELAARRKVFELPGVERRNERQHVFELHLVAAGREVHDHGIVAQLDPAVEPHRNGVQPQRVAREGEAVVRQIGVDHRDEFRLGAAQQRNAARDEAHLLRREPQIEVGAVGRHVAPEPQRKGRGRETHVRRIVLVADRSVRNPEIAHRHPERRGFGRLFGGSLLRGFVRRLHHVPVDGPVGQLVRMHGRRREDHLGHLEPAVAEQRHQVDDHRNPLRGDDRVALEAVHAHQREPFQIQRSVREMAQQADVELLEIELRREHFIGFALHDVGDLAPQRKRHDQGDRQNNGHHDGRDLHELFHSASVLIAKTVVAASSNPILR